jgi:hypothetical protein
MGRSSLPRKLMMMLLKFFNCFAEQIIAAIAGYIFDY